MLDPATFIKDLVLFSQLDNDKLEAEDLTISNIPQPSSSIPQWGRDVSHLLRVMEEHPEADVRDTVAELYSPEVLQLTVDAEANSPGVANEDLTKSVVDCMNQITVAAKQLRDLYTGSHIEQLNNTTAESLKALVDRIGSEEFRKQTIPVADEPEIRRLDPNDVQRILKFLKASSGFFLETTPEKIFQQMGNGQTSALNQMRDTKADWTRFIEADDSEAVKVDFSLPSTSKAEWSGDKAVDFCNEMLALDNVAGNMLSFLNSWVLLLRQMDREKHAPLLLDPAIPGRDGQINLTHALNIAMFVSGWLTAYANLYGLFWNQMRDFSRTIRGTVRLNLK